MYIHAFIQTSQCIYTYYMCIEMHAHMRKRKRCVFYVDKNDQSEIQFCPILNSDDRSQIY